MPEEEKTESLDHWLPRVANAPIQFNGETLVIRELSLLQRDRAVHIITDALLEGVRAAAKAGVVESDKRGSPVFKPSTAIRGLLSGIQDGEVSESLDSLIALLGDVLGGKLTEMVCTVLCNLKNAKIVLGDDSDLSDVLTDEISAKVSKKLASVITPRQEQETFRIWAQDVEKIGELLGNWKALLTSGLKGDSSKDQTKESPQTSSASGV